MLSWLENHPGIGALIVIGLILFSNSLIGEPRLERRIESLEVPECESCLKAPGYPKYVRPDLPVNLNPWPEGWVCNEWEGVCLD